MRIYDFMWKTKIRRLVIVDKAVDNNQYAAQFFLYTWFLIVFCLWNKALISSGCSCKDLFKIVIIYKSRRIGLFPLLNLTKSLQNVTKNDKWSHGDFFISYYYCCNYFPIALKFSNVMDVLCQNHDLKNCYVYSKPSRVYLTRQYKNSQNIYYSYFFLEIALKKCPSSSQVKLFRVKSTRQMTRFLFPITLKKCLLLFTLFRVDY